MPTAQRSRGSPRGAGKIESEQCVTLQAARTSRPTKERGSEGRREANQSRGPVMDETSASLLDRLRQQPDPETWQIFVTLYEPLLRGWMSRHHVPPHDADDVVQDVLAVVWRRIGEFHRERPGSFRAWLRTILTHCLQSHWRERRRTPTAPGGDDFHLIVEQLADPSSELSREWDAEHDRYVTAQLLELLRPEFSPQTWEAFHRVALLGEPPQQVADALGISRNAVFIAKSRVLARLRECGRGLIE